MTEESPVPSRVIEVIYEDLRDEYQIDVANSSKKSILSLIEKEQTKLNQLIAQASNIRKLHRLSIDKTNLKRSKTLILNHYQDFRKELNPLSKPIQYKLKGKTIFKSYNRWKPNEVHIIKSIVKKNPGLTHKPSVLLKKFNDESETQRSYKSFYYKLKRIRQQKGDEK